MSILQADGLEFGDGSILESLYGIIPQSKRMVFYQAAAPTGWTKLTQVSAPGDLDGSAIRVTSGAGGSVVGTTDFTASMPANPKAFASVSPALAAGSVGPHTLTLNELASHDHQVGAREVDDGPPSPTAYQAPATASYPDRVPYTAQKAYQQPSVYQQPVIYQQPDAYPQPQNRQRSIPDQNPGTYRQPKNPISQNPYQQAYRQDRRVTYNPNRQVTVPGPQSPGTTNSTGQVNVTVNRGQPQPVNRNEPSQNPYKQRRSVPNPVQYSFNVQNPYAERPNQRPDRRRQRRGPKRSRNRRQPRRNVQIPSTTFRPAQQNSRSRQDRREGTPNPQTTQKQRPRSIQVQAPGPIRINQQRSTNRQRQNPTGPLQRSYQRPTTKTVPQPNPNPFTVATPFRNPTLDQQPRSTRITANKRVSANTNVNANTNIPTRVPQVYQQSNINYSPYPQPLIVPGDQIRGDNTNTPNTSSVGGDNAHTHPFTGDDFGPQITAPSGFSMRVQYIDVIVCSFN